MSDKVNKPSIKERVVSLRTIDCIGEAEISRIINEEYFDNLKSHDACRSRVRNILGTKCKKKVKVMTKKKDNVSKTEPFILSAFNPTNGMVMNIEDYCTHYGLPIDDIKDNKLVTHTGTPYWNIHWKTSVDKQVESIDLDMFDSIVKKHISPVKFKKVNSESSDRTIIRAIYTDAHIAMCPNPEGKSLFGGVWNKKELLKRMREFASDIISRAKFDKSNVLYVDELGDFMDGWKGQTVRREHSIPQNMTTEDAFDLGVRFKVELADILVDSGQFSEITFNNICNDNHAGTFGYIVNSAVKSILDLKYGGLVKTINYKKFINYYTVGNHCFIISHGKDDKHLKFGFKPILDDKQIVKIDQYMKDNKLYRSSDYFEFSKGDSHQMVFDYSTSDDFNYMNYPAFSPSSDWVQTNFKKGRSGYVITSFSEFEKDISIFPRTFKWKR